MSKYTVVRTSLTVLVSCCVMALPSNAATIRVPADQPTIQAGISAAFAGDTVIVASGIYTGAGNRNMDYSGKDIAVRSENGPETTVIFLQGSPGSPARAYYFDHGESFAASLDGFTIRGGFSESHGGAITVDGASPTIRNCLFIDNEAVTEGGAVYFFPGYSGGVIENCVFESNAAQCGGAIDSDRPNLWVEDCVFQGNESTVYGGAVSVSDNSSFHDCLFDDNASNRGGAVMAWSRNGDSVFADCILVRNTGSSVFAVDRALDASMVRVQRCTFYDNSGTTFLVGYGSYVANLAVENTILTFAADGEAVNCNSVSIPVFSCTDIYGNAGGDWTECIADQHGILGNISADPLFCDPEYGDFNLHQESPCAPENAGICDLIGALPVECGIVSTTPTTWGAIKASFR